MCGYFNRVAMFFKVCGCGIFGTPVLKSQKIPRAPRGINMAHKHGQLAPPGRNSSSIVTGSTRSSESVYSCNSTDENDTHNVTKNTTVYSDWTFDKCLNDNHQSKIDVMKHNITNEKCIRKLYFKREERDFCKYGVNEWNIVMDMLY